MDNQMHNHEEGHKCESSSCCCGKRKWLKIVVILVVLGAIFAGGVATGGEFDHHKSERGGRFGMMDQGRGGFEGNFTEGNGVGMMGSEKGSEMMFGSFGKDGEEGDKGEASRLFGTVSGVAGNKITVKNNAGTDQVILSQADTVITSANVEVGLSSLKAGQNIILIGETGKDGQMTAKWINVVQ
jgi:hypothetical protein